MSNQISYNYYAFLVGEIAAGVTKKRVYRVERKNGSYVYSTYHLVVD